MVGSKQTEPRESKGFNQDHRMVGDVSLTTGNAEPAGNRDT